MGIMSGTHAQDIQDVASMIRGWSPEAKLALVRAILSTMWDVVGPDGLRGVPAEEVQGMGGGVGPPPDDATVRRWIEQYRTEKCG
jgi:hypothetical protein